MTREEAVAVVTSWRDFDEHERRRIVDAILARVSGAGIAVRVLEIAAIPEDIGKTWLGRAEKAEARGEALQKVLAEVRGWLRARPAITGDGWQRRDRKTVTEIEALIDAALGMEER